MPQNEDICSVKMAKEGNKCAFKKKKKNKGTALPLLFFKSKLQNVIQDVFKTPISLLKTACLKQQSCISVLDLYHRNAVH